MAITRKITNQITEGSWIRKMFEEGARMKARFGADAISDLSLGNPDLDPPPEVLDAIKKVASENPKHCHAYMPNSGFPATRERIAQELKDDLGLPFSANRIVMTVGAAGALNILLKVILEPMDEVIAIAPYFPEYRFYIDNQGGKLIKANPGKDFTLDLEDIEKKITKRTRAIIINSPNNPTGRMLRAEELKELADMLEWGAVQTGRPIYLISDEPYRTLLFDGLEYASPASFYENTIIVYSYSKTYSLAGERIGYLAIHPEAQDGKELFDGTTFVNRTLGFVNAPAFMQRVITETGTVKVDFSPYQERRDIIVAGLRDIGYKLVNPDGTFYVFPKTPILNDTIFVRALQKQRVLVTPGTGFAWPGYMRISLCTPNDVIERALPVFRSVFQEFRELSHE